MASIPYDIAQGVTKTISNPMYVAAIGGDNPSPFYLKFPQLPPGLQWVFPFTYNFMFPIAPPQQLRVDTTQTPPGFPTAPSSSTLALLTAWDTPQAFSPGTRSPSSITAPATYWLARGNASQAIGAGAAPQLLVIYHPNTVAEVIKIRKVVVTIESNTVATVLTLRIRRLNGGVAPSGGAAVAVVASASDDPALNVNDVIQSYPSTAGTADGSAVAAQSYSIGISAAPTDVTKLQPIVLYNHDDSLNRKPPTIRSLVAEGWELEVNSSAGSTVVASVAAEITVG